MEAATAQMAFRGPRRGPQALELGVEIAVLLAHGGPGGLDEGGLQPGGAFLRRVERRLPALSSWRGQRPAQEIR